MCILAIHTQSNSAVRAMGTRLGLCHGQFSIYMESFRTIMVNYHLNISTEPVSKAKSMSVIHRESARQTFVVNSVANAALSCVILPT